MRQLINKLLFRGKKPSFIDKPFNEFDSGQIQNILLLRQDRIGDLLISTPIIRNLKKALPDAEIDILLSDKNYGAAKSVIKYINNIWVYEKRVPYTLSLIRKLRTKKYNLIIDLFDNPSTTSSLIIKLTGPDYSLGLDKLNSNIYTHIVPLLDKTKFHPVERLVQILLPFNLNPSELDLSLEYHIGKVAKEKAGKMMGKKMAEIRLGINLSGSSKAKYWGTENFTALIKMIQDKYKNIEIFLFGTQEYLAEIKEIIYHTKVNAAPFADSIDEYASYLSTCDIILTPDTAAVHFAAAWKIPTIVLYTISDDMNTGMPWTGYNSPCFPITTMGNLSDIEVNEVFGNFQSIYLGEFES
jgi:ADP-heptose:LPS heptosyltransferase